MTIKMNAEVSLNVDLLSVDDESNGYIVPVGTKLTVGGADYDGDCELYILEGELSDRRIEVWAYRDSFEPLK